MCRPNQYLGSCNTILVLLVIFQSLSATGVCTRMVTLAGDASIRGPVNVKHGVCVCSTFPLKKLIFVLLGMKSVSSLIQSYEQYASKQYFCGNLFFLFLNAMCSILLGY